LLQETLSGPSSTSGQTLSHLAGLRLERCTVKKLGGRHFQLYGAPDLSSHPARAAPATGAVFALIEGMGQSGET
jgi:hypothetical protein